MKAFILSNEMLKCLKVPEFLDDAAHPPKNHESAFTDAANVLKKCFCSRENYLSNLLRVTDVLRLSS